jgi:phosphatidate cytidylyltransferase
LKEFFTRALSGLFFVGLLLMCLQYKETSAGLFYIFGLVCLFEFNRLIQQKNAMSYVFFSVLFGGFIFWETFFGSLKGLAEAVQILQVVNMFVLLFLIRDLFSKKNLPSLLNNQFINTTFYISSGFIFLALITDGFEPFNSLIILGMFILIWVNDSFAYFIGKNFGAQKLFPSISPKKTVEGFLGGLFFVAIGSYVISLYITTITFSHWLIIGVVISVFGTFGDLIESKYKRQANVKDSGIIMPGHGGLLDRLDSAIFAAPFVYLFLRIFDYVS